MRLFTFLGGLDDWLEASNQIQAILNLREVLHIPGSGYRCEIW